MGKILSVRLKPEKHFLITVGDYADSFVLKASSGRGVKITKRYICLFICLVTKAVHLEMVSSLSTQSFLAAFERFISRRGQCSKLFSDNGTNFKGAEAELSKMFSKAPEFFKEVNHAIISKGTSWSFIPPSAPHFGGLWEAGIKTVKSHIRKILGVQKLTFEEMSTFLCKIEACLNSRPLYPASDDPSDLLPLTPAHFLIREPLNAYPDHFWNRWSKEYINHLQKFNRWQNPSENLKIDALVLLKDNQLPATKWPLARVIDVAPGSDNLIRVATIKTATGTYQRPIVKLVPLPVQSNQQAI